MFDGKYLDLNNNRVKNIIDFYSQKFFFYKKILDLGCGHADVSGPLHRLGADITAIDAREQHLKIAAKKYPGIKTIKMDLDRGLQLKNQKFDMVLDIDIIGHLKNFEEHLKAVCAISTHIILETAVCDSDDPYKSVQIQENKATYDLAYNGIANYPTAAAIERILTECGMEFRRQDNEKFNSGNYKYNWQPKNDGSCNQNNRRLWFALKKGSPIQFAPTPVPAPIKKKEENFTTIPYVNSSTGKNKKFVIVIPSYKNVKWCEKNILSALNQKYDNFRILFIDDCSPDNTFQKVSDIVNRHPNRHRANIKRNDVRCGALENLYNMIYSCDDDEIIVTLDGDDWLANDDVLSTLNRYYSSQDIWMTYGQYQNYPDGAIGIAKQIPDKIIQTNNYRSYDWCASHLRTFYTWLFKKIKIEDLKYNGKFHESSWDGSIQYPQLEMAGTHSKFISDILYIYNLENPLNDHKVDLKLQQWYDHYIRTSPRYSRVEKPTILNKTTKKVGLLLIATNKYDRFLQGIISSADTFFLRDCNVTYYVFSDKMPQIKTNRNVVHINIQHKPFPYATMDRFKHFINNKDKMAQEDYLYYVDVDCLFVDTIKSEDILGNLVGVRHCGFTKGNGTFEDNVNSKLYLDPSRYQYYFAGGMNGGSKESFLTMAEWCYNIIEQELAAGRMPRWHDESALNTYMALNPPDKILSPSYHFPQSNIENYKKNWLPEVFNPKLLLLDKNHEEIRS